MLLLMQPRMHWLPLLAHGHLTHQDPQGLSCKAAPQPVLEHWGVPPEIKELALSNTRGCSAPSEQQHSCVLSSQVGTVCNPAEGALQPVTQVINPRCTVPLSTHGVNH